MTFAERMLQIDRRIIFLVIGLCTLFPLLFPVGLPIKISSEVRGVYDYIEGCLKGPSFCSRWISILPRSLNCIPRPSRSFAMPSTRILRVIAMTLWVSGTGLADQIVHADRQGSGQGQRQRLRLPGMEPWRQRRHHEYGARSLQCVPSRLWRTGPRKACRSWPACRPAGCQLCREPGAGNPGVEAWYVFGKDKYKFELGGGCTGVMAPGLYPLLRSGQINGLIGGLRGAAEYETLIGQKGKAIAGMDAQSATHLAIIVLVTICNIFYFSMRRQQTPARTDQDRKGYGSVRLKLYSAGGSRQA